MLLDELQILGWEEAQIEAALARCAEKFRTTVEEVVLCLNRLYVADELYGWPLDDLFTWLLVWDRMTAKKKQVTAIGRWADEGMPDWDIAQVLFRFAEDTHCTLLEAERRIEWVSGGPDAPLFPLEVYCANWIALKTFTDREWLRNSRHGEGLPQPRPAADAAAKPFRLRSPRAFFCLGSSASSPAKKPPPT